MIQIPSPALPRNFAVKDPDQSKFNGSLTVALMNYLTNMATRANGTLPKDGSEAFTGDLAISGNIAAQNAVFATLTVIGPVASGVFQRNDDANVGPTVSMYLNSASPAVSDILLRLLANGNSSTGVQRDFGLFANVVLDATNASEDAQWQWYNMQAGTLTNQMNLDSVTGLDLKVGGLKFPPSAIAFADANTMDDYEEGSWTPTIAGSTTAGVTTYVSQIGDYTKIGNRVFIKCEVQWSAQTGTGNIIVGGLPFTAGVNTAIHGLADNLTFANGFGGLLVLGGTTQAAPVTQVTGGAFANVPIDTVANLRFSGEYRI